MLGAFIGQLVIAAVCCVLGIVLIGGKGAFLIAGYNTASREEKAKYDEKALCRAVGIMMFVCALCFLLSGIGIYFDLLGIVWTGYILLPLAVIVGIVYVNRSKHLKRK